MNEYYSTFLNKEFIVGGEAGKGMMPERYIGLAILNRDPMPSYQYGIFYRFSENK